MLRSGQAGLRPSRRSSSTTMEPHNDLKTLLGETLELKNIDHEKLAGLTGISERYLWAIQNMEIDKLPPSPYVRGYLKKISEVLHLDHEELWQLYKKELEHNTSGKYDTLPENRFAIKHLSRRELFSLAVGALLIIYLLLNFPRLIGKPNLIITNPAEPVATTSENTVNLIGELNQRDKLTINGEEIFINPDGSFLKIYPLQPGLNTVEFKAKRFLGRETVISKQILYQPNSLTK